MEGPRYRRSHRISAAVLATGGMWWAILLMLAAMFPPAGLLYNAIFAPGWIVFLGWCYLAMDRFVGVPVRVFWTVSALVNLAYFVIHWEPWHAWASLDRALNPQGWWWLFAAGVSTVCAAIPPEGRARAQGD